MGLRRNDLLWHCESLFSTKRDHKIVTYNRKQDKTVIKMFYLSAYLVLSNRKGTIGRNINIFSAPIIFSEFHEFVFEVKYVPSFNSWKYSLRCKSPKPLYLVLYYNTRLLIAIVRKMQSPITCSILSLYQQLWSQIMCRLSPSLRGKLWLANYSGGCK